MIRLESMSRHICSYLLATCVLGFYFLSAQAHADERHALIIGNSDYGSRYSLINPLKDSTAIANKLASIGYKVHGDGPLLDLKLEQFEDAIDSFLANVEDGSSTLIYYAGHGATSRGNNYLIPILPEGIRLRSDADIRDRSVSLQGVLERVEASNPTGVNVFLFDACRDAPVESSTRNINLTGLASIDTGKQPRGSFVGFSTEYGQLALDGDVSGNSPFAAAVLDNLDVAAAAPIELFFKSVTDQVYDLTDGAQFPIQEAKLRGTHCIIECQTITSNIAPSDFGYLDVNAKPLDSEVCYRIDSWTTWNCGSQVPLPLNKEVMVRVTAKGHKTFTTAQRLTSPRQQITVALDPSGNHTWKIIGGVAAAVAIGALLSSGGGSGGSSGDGNPEEFSITVVRP